MHDDVISAFLDNEPFDPAALGRALADPAGRDLLLDAVALRHLVAGEEAGLAPMARPRGGRWTRAGLAVAAALALALGGYALGHRTGRTDERRAIDAAPAPTQVIDLTPGVQWHTIPGGHS